MTLLLRAVPAWVVARRGAVRLLERSVLVYRRSWMIIFSGFFEPVFYLLSIDLGLGDLVGHVAVNGREVPYGAFAAPALLASSAMNGAIYESTMNVFHKLRWARIYDAVLATPLAPADVALGEIGWCVIRGGLYAAGFLVVMIAMGLVSSVWAALVLPSAVLVGFAFAAVGLACTSYMRSWQDLDMVDLAVVPLFLFSATFYPLSTYPGWLQWAVRATPLYHGAELIRSLALGAVGLSELVHAAYLAVMGLVGLAVASKRLSRLLLP